MVDMCLCVLMMSDCQEMTKLWFSVEISNQGVSSGACDTCLLSCDVQVLNIEMVDDNGEGQAS